MVRMGQGKINDESVTVKCNDNVNESLNELLQTQMLTTCKKIWIN